MAYIDQLLIFIHHYYHQPHPAHDTQNDPHSPCSYVTVGFSISGRQSEVSLSPRISLPCVIEHRMKTLLVLGLDRLLLMFMSAKPAVDVQHNLNSPHSCVTVEFFVWGSRSEVSLSPILLPGVIEYDEPNSHMCWYQCLFDLIQCSCYNAGDEQEITENVVISSKWKI